MDGMIVGTHSLSTGGTGQIVISNTINLPSPHAAVAEITLSTFDTASAQFGTPVTAFGIFDRCTTDGSNPPLPPNETFAQGSISGRPRHVVVRNGLKSLTYEIEVTNASADFVINIFLWPAVDRGNL
jgi:hypothetical protein